MFWGFLFTNTSLNKEARQALRDPPCEDRLCDPFTGVINQARRTHGRGSQERGPRGGTAARRGSRGFWELATFCFWSCAGYVQGLVCENPSSCIRLCPFSCGLYFIKKFQFAAENWKSQERRRRPFSSILFPLGGVLNSSLQVTRSPPGTDPPLGLGLGRGPLPPRGLSPGPARRRARSARRASHGR